MVAYGDTTTIAQMLEPDTPSGFSASLTARIDAQREVVSRLIDEKTGRSFGSVGTSETRTIRPGGSSDVLILPAPARSISAITVDCTDEGGVISGGTALTTAQWRVALTDSDGTITALSGTWDGITTVTGIWADSDTDTTVPDDITWLCNYVAAKTLAEENSSPSGFVGSDGSVTFPRNPWSHPQVKAILLKHRIPQKVLVL